MSDVTQILSQIESGDRHAPEKLLPLVYDELLKLAAARMANERSDHTLQATALVHEAYLRLTGSQSEQNWNGRGHFFAAAAEAMRRILVDNARSKARLKRGGDRKRVELDEDFVEFSARPEHVLAVDEALDGLAAVDARSAKIVKMHYYAGLKIEEAAEVLGVSHRTAYRDWEFSRAWLARTLGETDKK
jgi:RNA polymerase sigma factor (TIGR02999 family)